MAETLELFSGTGLPGSDIVDAEAWDDWTREQDSQVRARVERGEEDSISNLILYGTSYTDLPRLDVAESAVTSEGLVTHAAEARVQALIAAVGAKTSNERILIVGDFLRRKGIAPEYLQQFLTANLQRVAEEHRVYQRKMVEAANSGKKNRVQSTLGTLYQTRGLSADTSLFANYALEDTLRALAAKKLLSPGSIRRIAVIGPGLDFTNKHSGHDFYPLQTIQPFAVMETALRLKLALPEAVEVVTMDLNPGVIAHVAKLSKDARAGRAYTVQLPGDSEGDWAQPAADYWKNFGEILGSPADPIPVPDALGRVTLRAVAIAPKFASRVTPLDLNIVAQRVDLTPGQGFDLVVATNILVYYDRFQQALALTSIAHMLNPGGIFLANDRLSGQHVASLEFLEHHSVSFVATGPYGDTVLAFRRR